MPVIRYRTRDLTRLLPRHARPMRRIDRINGRSDDMLIIRGVNVFPSKIEAVLAQENTARAALSAGTAPARQAGRTRSAGRNAARAEFARSMARLADQTPEHLDQSYVGVTTKVRVVEPGARRTLAGQGETRPRPAA